MIVTAEINLDFWQIIRQIITEIYKSSICSMRAPSQNAISHVHACASPAALFQAMPAFSGNASFFRQCQTERYLS
ncbi:MAG: hypothetical protein OCU22_05610 [Canidatus Methanoxibalbensis ujae]|nr:hypothetical protein [Candidatus Methanoxibalbensis ujae]